MVLYNPDPRFVPGSDYWAAPPRSTDTRVGVDFWRPATAAEAKTLYVPPVPAPRDENPYAPYTEPVASPDMAPANELYPVERPQGVGPAIGESLRNNPFQWGQIASSLARGSGVTREKRGPFQELAAGIRGALSEDMGRARAADMTLTASREKRAAEAANMRAMQEAIRADTSLSDASRLYYMANPSAYADVMKARATGAGGPKASLVPIWGEDADGNPVLVQPTDQGTAIQTQLPEGFTPSKGIDRVDGGTEWILLDKQTGAVVGRQPKDLAGAEREKEIGKQQGEAISDLPTAIGKADAALKTIDQLRNHPGRKGGVGMSAWQTWVPGSPEYDFSVQLKQAQGQVFLSAYQDLKGGGQITEIEGQKAEQAIARLDNWQSEEAFESALNDLEEVIRNGLKRAQQRARGEVPEVPASVNTQPPAGVDPEAWKYMTPEERALWN